jgi:hypothetical protein
MPKTSTQTTRRRRRRRRRSRRALRALSPSWKRCGTRFFWVALESAQMRRKKGRGGKLFDTRV